MSTSTEREFGETPDDWAERIMKKVAEDFDRGKSTMKFCNHAHHEYGSDCPVLTSESVVPDTVLQSLTAQLESQASALVRVVGERDRLRKVLEMMICYGCHNRIGWNETPTKYGDWTKCSSCREARALLTTLITTGQEEG